jgi:hypothetical protein
MTGQYEVKPIGEVEGLGLVRQVYASLDKQILTLGNAGIKHPFLVTPEETAMIRLAGLSNDCTRTCIAPVGVKGENTLLYRPSIFMDPEMAAIAVSTHSQGKYPTLDRVVYEVLKERAKRELSLAPEDRTTQTLSSSEDYDLTPEMDDSRFLLGKQTAEYFKKFECPSIKLYNLPTAEISEDKCVVNYLWFGGPNLDSGFDCRNKALNLEDWAFAILIKNAKGTSENSGYSLTNVKDAVAAAIPETLVELGITGIENLGLEKDLEKRVLETLRTQ